MNFKDMIEGKNILFLGPASYLYNEAFIEDLSDYDVVIKLNRMVETDICKEFKNDRCDILYHCLDISPQNGNFKYNLEVIRERGVVHIRSPFPPLWPWAKKMLDIFKRDNNNLIDHSVVDVEFYNKLRQGCNNTMPNTGTIAIFDILRFNPKSLTIYGITMFKGGYNKSYRSKNTTEEEIESLNEKAKNHNNEFQKLFIRREIIKYNNVKYDKHFSEAVGIE